LLKVHVTYKSHFSSVIWQKKEISSLKRVNIVYSIINFILGVFLSGVAYKKCVTAGAILFEAQTTGLNLKPVYKSVSIRDYLEVTCLKLREGVQAFLNGALNDPVVQILAKNSQLTKTQLETLLIDVLAENMMGKQLKYDEKARLRLTKAKISRGAFNRTLKQSKENVIKSIYTVLLLGYLGVFESTSLDPYLEIANKLHEYIEAHKDTPQEGEELKERQKVIEIIREELETSLKRLSSPSEDRL